MLFAEILHHLTTKPHERTADLARKSAERRMLM